MPLRKLFEELLNACASADIIRISFSKVVVGGCDSVGELEIVGDDDKVGPELGCDEVVGELDGDVEGDAVGFAEGGNEGDDVGIPVGLNEIVGSAVVGSGVGIFVGFGVGSAVVGCRVGNPVPQSVEPEVSEVNEHACS